MRSTRATAFVLCELDGSKIAVAATVPVHEERALLGSAHARDSAYGAGANVDVKKSSYKKLSKLLTTFEKKVRALEDCTCHLLPG